MGTKVVARLMLCMTLLALTGCVGTTITPQPGPLYINPSNPYGGVHIGVAVAGKRAGGPCLQGPVCLIPR